MEKLIELYKDTMGQAPADCHAITGSGSHRQYFRLMAPDGGTLIGVVGTSVEENGAFVHLARHFAERQLPVPHVVAVSQDGRRYLQTDLGERSLFDALSHGRANGGQYNDEERALLHRTIAQLPRIQVLGGEGLDYSVCYPQAMMDKRNVLFDLNYFKYCFLMVTGTDFHEQRLEDDFQQMATDLTAHTGQTFLYRDFQARNVMLDAEGNPSFIDFQGGRRGPLQYDVASFLWQASARYSDELRESLLDTYLRELSRLMPVDTALFRQRLQIFVLFRLLQVLGAYGLRGLIERKRHFLDSIPPALASLSRVHCPYPHLAQVIGCLVSNPALTKPSQAASGSTQAALGSKLRVRVFSFSYKKGIPEDESGNGGGYVFDCRAVHNPGKYDQYKQLTGLDKPVRDFLEQDGEILTFLESVDRLADAHVERYMERGFSDLMFSFGCTGGQHRSVYSAEHVGRHLHGKYGIEVDICHRERGILTHLPSRKKAMVFAAGLGTRLKPLTDTMPKALVPIGGRPLLAHVLDKLRGAGFTDVVINVHHFADQIESWCQGRPGLRLSDERRELLDTGGGIRHARALLGDAPRFLVHNVDILSNVDLEAFWRQGEGHDATLLVSERQTQRYLLFDPATMRLVGWTNVATGQVKSPFPDLRPADCRMLAFAGIHQMSTALLPLMDQWPERFGIIDFYLAVCRDRDIRGYVQPSLRLLDVGKIDVLGDAERFAEDIR